MLTYIPWSSLYRLIIPGMIWLQWSQYFENADV